MANLERKPIRKRVFEIVQFERYPTGDKRGELTGFTEENIFRGLDYKSIKEWAWVCHDKDPITEEEEQKGLGKAGDIKGRHWHIVIRTKNAIDVEKIAEWFGVPINMIELPFGGERAFLDKVEYLTHERLKEQTLGKHRYDDEEIHANFPWRVQLDERVERLKETGGKYLNPEDFLLYMIRYKGMTLRQAQKRDDYTFMKNERKYQVARANYLADQLPPVKRINYYVTGKGGIGKDLLCVGMARSLYPEIRDDDDLFFTVGGDNVAFDGYDGQPVIIYEEVRANTLIKLLKGREEAFKALNTFPKKKAMQSIKFGKTNLINEVNIINSVQTYEEFLDGLSGEYEDRYGTKHKAEDKSQAYRRFPFIIPIDEYHIEMMVNKGYYHGTREYQEYLTYGKFQNNLRQVAIDTTGSPELERIVHQKQFKQVKENHDYVKDRLHEGLSKQEIVNKYNLEKQLELPLEQDSLVVDVESEDVE